MVGVEVDLHTKWVLVRSRDLTPEAILQAMAQAGYDAELSTIRSDRE